MKADTPRTEEVLLHCPSHLQEVALANLAQDLERELFHSLKNQLKVQTEVERLKAALQSCWHTANTYDGNYTRACDSVMHIANATLKIANPEDK
jgi:thymidine kinase